jgi:hypothetical protein
MRNKLLDSPACFLKAQHVDCGSFGIWKTSSFRRAGTEEERVCTTQKAESRDHIIYLKASTGLFW